MKKKIIIFKNHYFDVDEMQSWFYVEEKKSLYVVLKGQNEKLYVVCEKNEFIEFCETIIVEVIN